MVTAVLEVHRGVDNLWKSGASAGMKAYPNYGQYIPVNYMKAFLHGLPYLWADEMYWDVDANMLPFDFMFPWHSTISHGNKSCCSLERSLFGIKVLQLQSPLLSQL